MSNSITGLSTPNTAQSLNSISKVKIAEKQLQRLANATKTSDASSTALEQRLSSQQQLDNTTQKEPGFFDKALKHAKKPVILIASVALGAMVGIVASTPLSWWAIPTALCVAGLADALFGAINALLNT